ADPEIESRSAVHVALGVLREIWLSAVLVHKLHIVTEAVLDSLAKQRGPGVLKELKGGVAVVMRLAPQYRRTLSECIYCFAKRRFRAESIPVLRNGTLV